MNRYLVYLLANEKTARIKEEYREGRMKIISRHGESRTRPKDYSLPSIHPLPHRNLWGLLDSPVINLEGLNQIMEEPK